MEKGYVVFNIAYCKKTGLNLYNQIYDQDYKRYCTSNIDKFRDMVMLLIMDGNIARCWVEIKYDEDEDD